MTSSSTAMASSLAVRVQENRDSFEPAGECGAVTAGPGEGGLGQEPSGTAASSNPHPTPPEGSAQHPPLGFGKRDKLRCWLRWPGPQAPSFQAHGHQLDTKRSRRSHASSFRIRVRTKCPALADPGPQVTSHSGYRSKDTCPEVLRRPSRHFPEKPRWPSCPVPPN